MKGKRFTYLAFMALIILSGCASQSGWRPTVDPYNDPRAAYINQDLVECEMLAKRVSGYTPEETAKGALVGGAIGAAAGAAIGAATGSPGQGAAIGAAAGGIGGGTYKGLDAEQKYKDAYIRCMRQRGHNVLN
ncbi:MAG: hypothetical protein DSZ23_03570 [Thermodesulfatator sp.]|nr:MAG: hypothetical protein DSZ23_03570 [Thermodesulfatator sp.]